MVNTKTRSIQKALHRVWLVAVFLQSIWLLVLYSGWFINSGLLDMYIEFLGTSGDKPEATLDLPEFIAQPLVVIIFIAILTIIFVILSRAPKTSAHVTVTATTKISHSLEPAVKHVVPIHSTLHRPWYVRTLTYFVINILVFAVTIPMHFVTSDISGTVLWAVSSSLLIVAMTSLALSVGIKRMH